MHYQLFYMCTKLLGDNSLCVLCFYTFCKRTTDCFFILDYIFKDGCLQTTLEEKG